MQIVAGVYLINGFPYGLHQNSYLVKTASGSFLIDSGDMAEDSFDLVARNCRRWGVDLGSVSHLLVTHAHFDHSSHAARLRRLGVKIVASRDTAEAMAVADERCIAYAVGKPFEACETDVVVDDGSVLEIDGVQVACIGAPGHANGLMIYEVHLDSERLWFCGDLMEVGPECKSVQLGWSGGPDYDRPTYLRTLRRLVQMQCDILLPGHGPPLIGRGLRLVEMAYTKAMVEWR